MIKALRMDSFARAMKSTGKVKRCSSHPVFLLAFTPSFRHHHVLPLPWPFTLTSLAQHNGSILGGTQRLNSPAAGKVERPVLTRGWFRPVDWVDRSFQGWHRKPERPTFSIDQECEFNVTDAVSSKEVSSLKRDRSGFIVYPSCYSVW